LILSIPFFVRSTQGLEDVVADELRLLPGIRVEEVKHRTVSGISEGSPAVLFSLRTADDAFLALAAFGAMERARSALTHLAEQLAAIEIRPALELLAQLRPLPPRPGLSLSASFVGRRNYTTAELKDVLGRGVAARSGLTREVDDAKAALHLRLVLDHDNARLGLRLGREPLHERRWKCAHVPGSLKPSVAAALWRLVGLAAGSRALDVCCGAGTLVAEAAAVGAHAVGGDLARPALLAASANLSALGAPASLVRWDARSLPLAEGSIDRVASNLPWGRQVGSAAPLAALYAGIDAELARVLVPGGRAVVLTGAPDAFAAGRLRLEARREIGLSGQRPSVLLLSRPAQAA
jgi:tRNA (guanine6-N2)-methyltransferase